jgi:hypothetical protein
VQRSYILPDQDGKRINMKHLFSIAFVALITVFLGCNKDVADTATSTSIVGSWELRQTSAAMLPTPSTYPVGNGTILKFTDSTYESYDKGTLVKSGNYTVVEDSTFEENVCMVQQPGMFRHRIIYDGNTTATKQFIQVISNKLIFMSGCYAVDAGTNTQYEKISESGK